MLLLFCCLIVVVILLLLVCTYCCCGGRPLLPRPSSSFGIFYSAFPPTQATYSRPKMTTFIYSFPLIILSLYFIPSTVSVSLNETDNYVRRISDSDLFYAAESRNYPETPDTLFVTMRGGGVKVFDISEPAELKGVAQWVTDKAVEGQDRVGDLLVVAELGRG